MAQGISLHIGLNYVDPNAYDGWNGELFGCINDANAMQSIADGLGYRSSKLIDAQATAAAVTSQIGAAASELKAGDIFLLTFAGHGSQVPDAAGEEDDGKNETWLLWDRMLVDNELYQLWSQFASGVRVFMVSDSCHSGTMLRAQQTRAFLQADNAARKLRTVREPRFRFMPPELAAGVYRRNREFFTALQWVTRTKRAPISCSVILISGCQDWQTSGDGDTNGLFTGELLKVWNNGGFTGAYRSFHNQIAAHMPPVQTPNFATTGATNAIFEGERPFTIGSAALPAQITKPKISGPEQLARDSAPPTFHVDPGSGRHFAVEVATEALLFEFDRASERTSENFFGSWSILPFASAGSYPSVYALPGDVWELLKAAPRLYYRLWSSESVDGWLNEDTSLLDAEASAAPSIEITESVQPLPSGPMLIEPWSQSVGAEPPTFSIELSANRFFAVEVSTSAHLFDVDNHGTERNENNFYGSWESESFYGGPYPASYTIPQSTWDTLRAGGETQLFYRLWSTALSDGWSDDYDTTTADADAASAPSIEITQDRVAISGRNRKAKDSRFMLAQ